MREAFGDDAIRLTKNHAKFVLIQNDAWDLVVRTSMNLNENRRLENWELSDSAEMAAYLVDVVDELFREQGETFEMRPYDHKQAFLRQWGETQVGDATEDDPAFARMFGDGLLDTDLRRAGGVTYG